MQICFSEQSNGDASMQMQELAQLLDKDKWWRDFNAKKGMDATSMQMQTLCGFMIRTIGVATLQRLLRWLHWKDKCWCSLITEESMLCNKNKQQQKNLSEENLMARLN